MNYIHTTAYDIGARFIGTREVAGSLDNPMIMAMLKLTAEGGWNGWPEHDEVPWCSGFANLVCWLVRLPRSKSLLARSWLAVGRPIALEEAWAANDVVVLKRGGGHQPGPDNLTAPGHVGFFSAVEGGEILVLGGNQGNAVSLARYPRERLLGVRRLLG